MILLVTLTLFVAEYLNPSAIGVRADYTQAKADSTTHKKQTSPEKETPTATPHFMVKHEPYRPGEILPTGNLITFSQSITEQANSKEIFHPPAIIL
jgi:hypothetical protein